MKNEVLVRIINMCVVKIALVALFILGTVIPELGWFLNQDTVLLVIVTAYIGYSIYSYIDVFECKISQKYSPQEGDR